MAEDSSRGEGDGASAPSGASGRLAREWEPARARFLHSGKSMAALAEENGVSESTFRNRVKEFGWVRVVPVDRRRKPGKGKRPDRTLGDQSAEAARRTRIAARLFKALDRKIEILEARMAQASEACAPESATDTERDIRAMTALMQIYAKLVALDDAARASDAAETRDSARTDDDADRLRRDLADRLARLSGGGNA